MPGLTTIVSYDNGANFTYDNTKVDFPGSNVYLKNLIGDVLYYALRSDKVEKRGLAGTATENGAPGIVGSKCSFLNAADALLFSSTSPMFSSEGTIRYKITPNYSGNPAANRYHFFMAESSSTTGYNTISLHHGTSGQLILTVRNSAGGAVTVYNLGAWSPTSGTEYEIELDASTLTPMHRVYINGAAFGYYAGAFTRTNISYLIVGNTTSLSNNADAYIRDFQVYSSIQHTGVGGFTSEIPRTEQFTYTQVEQTITVNSAIELDSWTSFDATLTAPVNTDYGFIVKLNNTNKYWDGAAWSNSNGTLAQSNTYADINTNITSLTVSDGVAVKIVLILSSSDGYTTPYAEDFTMEYDFFASLTAPSECVVYGYVLGMEGEGLEGAVITFQANQFEYGENLVGVKTKTTTDANGFFEISLIETATPNATVTATIAYQSSTQKIKKRYTGIIPNSITESFTAIFTEEV